MIKKFATLGAILLVPAQPASAQDASPTRVRVGVGVQTTPEYIGADKNEFGPLVDIGIARNGENFRLKGVDDSFSISVFDKGGFSVGPLANYEPGRKNKDVGADVGKVSGTIELGAFAQYVLPSNTRFRLEMRKGMGGHKGFVGQLGADQFWRDGDKWDFGIGPRLTFGDGRFMDSFFEVDAAHALTSGLPVYNPSGGIYSVGLASNMHYAVGGGFGLFGYGKVEQLVGDAADSPITKEFGSKTQLSAGLGVSYTFSMNN